MKAEYIIIIIVVILIVIHFSKTSTQNQISPSPEPIAKPSPVITLTPPSPAPVVKSNPTPVVQSSPVDVIQPGPAPVVQSSPAPVVQSSPAPVVQSSTIAVIPPSPTPVVQPNPASEIPYDFPSINQFWAPLSTPSYTPQSQFNLPYNISDIEIFDDSNYNAIIITKNNQGTTNIIPNVKVCCGRNVSLIIDKDNIGTDLDFTLSNGSVAKPIFSLQSTNKDKYYYAMAVLINNLDKLVDQFNITVGRIPTPREYRNRPVRIEVAYINAGGYASHGITGMACGPAFLRYFYDSCVAYIEDNAQLPKFEHVFTYELCRNYIFPDEFTPLFDYRLYDLSDRNNNTKTLKFWEWGWVNQGFVNVFGGLLTKNIVPAVNFNYFGYDGEQFWRSMERHLDTYLNGLNSGIYTWDNTFMYHRMIWTANAANPGGAESLDNLYSGILIRLWRNNGSNVFLLRFFRAIKLMNNRNAYHFYNLPNKLDYIDNLSTSLDDVKLNAQTAAENFYIASSYGATRDLYDYFVNTLKRSIRSEAQTYVINLIRNNP